VKFMKRIKGGGAQAKNLGTCLGLSSTQLSWNPVLQGWPDFWTQ
jgi:hypothetical protein